MYISTNWLKNFIKIDKIDQTTTLKTNEFEKILAYSQKCLFHISMTNNALTIKYYTKNYSIFNLIFSKFEIKVS